MPHSGFEEEPFGLCHKLGFYEADSEIEFNLQDTCWVQCLCKREGNWIE